MADNEVPQSSNQSEINNSVTEDEVETVTMAEWLKEEQELEEDAKAVLGASDDKNCTYSKGYIKRQALYACTTCIPVNKDDTSQCAGICLACSYNCHEGHTLVELYTKRNFRCDCGNSKFTDKKCTLEVDKEDLNVNNAYNQNFIGLYCNCNRPYPDPESDISDDMIQCIICEDWYHCRHLNAQIPQQDNYAEMICEECIKKHTFLLNYVGLSVSVISNDKKDNAVEVNVDNESPKEDNSENAKENEPVLETPTDCKMPKIKSEISSTTFWPESWRTQLCTCTNCLEVYNKENVSFLIDTQDTVQVYEEQGKAKNNSQSQYEAGLEALSSLDRIKAVEAISRYNELKDHLKDYLQKFAENKKIVREEDIKEFFSSMEAKKKQKVEIPYFCR